jgi:hypothetical protein
VRSCACRLGETGSQSPWFGINLEESIHGERREASFAQAANQELEQE